MPNTDMRRAAEKAQKAERERVKAARAKHLTDMAAERRAARAAIERVSGPKLPFPTWRNSRVGR